MLAERVHSPRRHAQQRGDFADCQQQGCSKRKRKTCQTLMTGGILAPGMSSSCDSLRILATLCDKPIRPFKPRVVGSIPTRLTLEQDAKVTIQQASGAQSQVQSDFFQPLPYMHASQVLVQTAPSAACAACRALAAQFALSLLKSTSALVGCVQDELAQPRKVTPHAAINRSLDMQRLLRRCRVSRRCPSAASGSPLCKESGLCAIVVKSMERPRRSASLLARAFALALCAACGSESQSGLPAPRPDVNVYKVYGIVDPSAYGAADRAGTAWTDPGVVR